MKLPDSIDRTRDGQYCIRCLAERITRVVTDGKTYYHCAACGATEERSLVIDDAITWWVDEHGVYWHESVGALILDERGRLLTILRASYPFAHAIPAGHLDKGEEPLAAIRREVKEEIGLALPGEAFRPLGSFPIPGDACRRGSDDHRWHLYLVRLPSSAPIVAQPEEIQSWAWCTAQEIAAQTRVAYPLRVFLERFPQVFKAQKL